LTAVLALVVGVAAGVGVGAALFDDGSGDATPADPSSTATAGAALTDPRADVAAIPGTRDLEAVDASLPDGFRASIAADGLPYGTTFAVDGEGGGYLGVLEEGRQGAVYRLHDADGDGVMEDLERLARMPGLVGGFLVRPEGVYISQPGGIVLAAGDDVEGARQVVSGLPVAAEIDIHSTAGMVVGPDGDLYFGLGATCNACEEDDPRSASIMRCELSGSGCAVFASGIRNPWDLAFDPADGSLWAADNGPDPLGTPVLDVADEVNRVQADHDYGFPFCWGVDRGFDCTGSEPAALELGAHLAPAGLTFYAGDGFPEEYRDDLYVSLWGGRRVIRVEIEGDPTQGYTATSSDFATFDRPVDVVADGEGGLLVLDADAARIYRITADG
jgi:glucose/arabinose dehydrogenase